MSISPGALTWHDISAWRGSRFAGPTKYNSHGVTELAAPGVSPMISGTSPMAPSTSTVSTCGGIGGSLPQASFGLGASPTGPSSDMGSSMTGASSTPTPHFD